jgi:hypothetical protein
LNAASLLSQVVVEGHDGELRESLPPLEFGYTTFEPAKRRYQPFTGAVGSRPERSLGDPEYELVDLFGNGLPTVLELNEQVRYWRNLGGGRFDLPRAMETAPAGVQLSAPGVQLLDANGNGRADLMVIDGLRDGYFPLNFNGQWNKRRFVRYRNAPTVNLDAPDVRLMDPKRLLIGDVDGDGVADIVYVSSGRVTVWINQNGAAWSDPIVIHGTPPVADGTLATLSTPTATCDRKLRRDISTGTTATR